MSTTTNRKARNGNGHNPRCTNRDECRSRNRNLTNGLCPPCNKRLVRPYTTPHQQQVPTEPLQPFITAHLAANKLHHASGTANERHLQLGTFTQEYLRQITHRPTVNVLTADEISTHIGHHPAEIYGPDWYTAYDQVLHLSPKPPRKQRTDKGSAKAPRRSQVQAAEHRRQQQRTDDYA